MQNCTWCDGILFGKEKLGEWEAFSLFYAVPQKQVLYSLEIGQEVTVGKYPFDQDAVVARILRGTKPAKVTRRSTATMSC